ncbi:DNA-directed RNA polymerase II RPB11A [Toxoplasma gondii ME49]|uniref:DNA-directed RNA polymerase II RPB11A n=3 Tax=Toxoplasma gondii TaxID=5811 RepID=B6K9P6_TOXGV|nr:DNA-directed RNA polymerase II RPB11A [Toxoplasma gondii ME49]EPT25693.1 DNA-directed RNA polymerase II RPB11A [Toxoplasma gondii ME49]ESS35301.1 DNA-directed RNA polymerase II RPB11A [Toxoplasma gondii VEG]KFG36749.1 DNA-directed RNA polymerase II RPB11A [Toxoplasma gondii GAB2-2007-GAL-DOM2]|eukprot:XP_002364770.1 DNA-directed RNA polymerase II RPB11A [Toxoplasma gondii ME49]
MVKQSTMVNRLDAADVTELAPGVHKVEWVPDTRFPLCGTFVFHLEDYTIGYIIRNDLLNDPRVKFVGLRQPHPLEPKIELRIQTVSSNPFTLVLESLRKRKAGLSLLKARFKAAVGAAPVVQTTDGVLFHSGDAAKSMDPMGVSMRGLLYLPGEEEARIAIIVVTISRRRTADLDSFL